MQPEGARSPLEMDAAGEPSMFISVPDVNAAPSVAGTISTPQKKSGIFGASSNLVNSIVGAGIIGIPYALKQSGLVTGVLLLLLVAYLTGKRTKMLHF
jgi:Transmembrane amino acid transporter protein